MSYIYHKGHHGDDGRQGAPIKSWTNGVPFDWNALRQVQNVSSLPFVHKHIAVMPDVHWGIGATVGSVIPTDRAIIPAAVGVDIGCGMAAVQLEGVSASDLPDSLAGLRAGIEDAIPVGRASYPDTGAVRGDLPQNTQALLDFFAEKHPKLYQRRNHTAAGTIASQLGTLGGGNHFIELCLDTEDGVWVMLHSGSRGMGNQIGRHFIELAKEDMRLHHVNLPDKDLAYFGEGTEHFRDYVFAVGWAQNYARANRDAMQARIIKVLREHLPPFQLSEPAVNCHHNYVVREHHFGKNVWVTRKGAVRAREGDLGIIPGSMGTRSYIVRGKGNPDSFHSCSHGAGRVMSRGQAKKQISLADHEAATVGVECRKDAGVLDESPAAYKDIDAVMAAQDDLVEVVHELRAVVCVKG